MTHLSREFGLSHMGYLAIFLIGTGAAHVSAQAQSAEQPKELQAIYACKVKTNSDERLACYDAAIGNFETAEKSGEIITFDTQENKNEKRNLFGKKKKAEQPASRQSSKVKSGFDDNVKEVSFHIDRTKAFGRKKNRFYFSNGQIWEQTQDEVLRIPESKNGEINIANIRKASFGSYMLNINGKGKAVRVKRVK
ncbi:MAG: hypothetical protein ABJG88_11155 [Litorimonas sp.]